MSNCPICSDVILRHISRNKIYWYCPCCHQEMPNFTSIKLSKLLEEQQREKLLTNSLSYLKPVATCS